jgi:hypothetical protein
MMVALLCLELVQDLIEMIDLFVCVVVPFLGWIAEAGKVGDHQRILLRATPRADKDALGANLLASNVAYTRSVPSESE